MSIRELIFLLVGTAAAFIVAWFIIVRKFILFINNEREHNEAYRLNAKNDYNKIAPNHENINDLGDEEHEQIES